MTPLSEAAQAVVAKHRRRLDSLKATVEQRRSKIMRTYDVAKDSRRGRRRDRALRALEAWQARQAKAITTRLKAEMATVGGPAPA